MKNLSINKVRRPCAGKPFRGARPESEATYVRIPLPEGWRVLETGLPDTRLYRVKLAGGFYWVAAAVTHHGEVVHRRFASELHARVWLSLASEPHFSRNPFNLEELNQPYRTACHLRGGKAMPLTASGG